MKKNLNEVLSVNDYAVLNLMASEEVSPAVVCRVDEEHYQIMSELSCIDGGNIVEDESLRELANGFRYHWFVEEDADMSAEAVIKYVKEFDEKDIAIVTGKPKLPKKESFMSKKYTNNVIFSGIHGYHDHHGCEFNTPKRNKFAYRIGVELEVEFNNSSLKRKFGEAKSNWFFLERDGSLGDNGCEIITVPLAPKDAKDVEFWGGLIDYLQGKAKSWDTTTCGLHVHIGREILGDDAAKASETTGKLLYLYHHYLEDTRWNKKVFGRAEAYSARDGKTEYGRAIKTLGTDISLRNKTLQKNLCKEMIDLNSSARYYDINLTNGATIEFRKGRGSLKATRIAAVVEYVELMTLYAKMSAWTSISTEGFLAYLHKRVKKTSPLYALIEPEERD